MKLSVQCAALLLFFAAFLCTPVPAQKVSADCPVGMTLTCRLGICSCTGKYSRVCVAGRQINILGTCEVCPKGTYKLTTSANACSKCPSNSVATAATGSTALAAACNCNAGTTVGCSGQCCSSCPQNTYKASAGSSACSKCPKFTTTKSTGATSVTSCTGAGYVVSGSTLVCKAGYGSSQSSLDCIPCAADTYKDSVGRTACNSCPKGSTTNSKTAATSVNACVAKPGWTSSGKNTFTCAPGYGGDNCKSCPLNTYKDVVGFGACKACPVNSITILTGRSSITSCFGLPYEITSSNDITCRPGFTPGTGKDCLPCPLDYYKSSKGPGACVACSNGFSTNGIQGAMVCLLRWNYAVNISGLQITCNTGYYGDRCSPCPADTFKSTLGSDACQACPKDTGTGGKTGSYAASSCVPKFGWTSDGKTCTLGYYGPTCSQCPVDTYKSEIGFQSCSPCPLGSTTNGTLMQTAKSACIALPGWVDTGSSQFACQAGFGGSSCAPCPSDTFKAIVGNGNCTACPVGSFTNGTIGSTAVSACVALPSWVALSDGSFTCLPGFSGPTCSPCPANTYKNATGSSICTPCIQGTSTNGALGQTSASSCISLNGWINDPVLGHTCNVGFGGNSCSACPASSFKPTAGFAECSSCPANSVSTGAIGQSSVTAACKCKTGYSGLVNNSSSCTPCPIGTFKSNSGNSQSCTACPVGSTTANTGSEYLTDCIASPGYTSDANGGFTCAKGFYGPTCTACAAGSYKSSVGVGACTACNSSTSVSSGLTGQSSAMQACLCKPGFYNTVFSNDTCFACPQDTYKAESGNSYSCTGCPEHSSTASVMGATSLNQCKALLGYVMINNGSFTCDVGYGGANCAECPENTFKDTVGFDACVACPTGSSTFGADGQAQRESCTALPGYGLYGNQTFTCKPGFETANCTACSPGFYKTAPGFEPCTPCPENSRRLDYTGATSAVEGCACESGYYGLNEALAGCVACPADTYKAEVGNGNSCNSCPLGTSTNGATGSTMASQCSTVVGWVRQGDGSYTCDLGYFGSLCNPCAAGTFKGTIGSGNCTGCPTSSQTNGATAAVSAVSGCQCLIGYYGLNNSSYECNPCPTDTFKSTTNSGECTPCPRGTGTNGALGSALQSSCLVKSGFISAGNGTYTCAAGYSGESCSPCIAGTYKSLNGDGACQQCPAGSVGNGLTGQTTDLGACTCSAGYGGSYSSAFALSCSPCEEDTFKPSVGNGVCSTCPRGTTTIGQRGAVSTASCLIADSFTVDSTGKVVCKAGRSGANCSLCPSGSYKADVGDGACIRCPTGSIASGLTGQFSVKNACTCVAGYYGLDGSIGECDSCPINSFKSTVGNVQSCSACPNGTSTFGFMGQTSIAGCLPLTGFALVNGSVVCAAGYTGASCTACPANTFKNTTGSADCISCGTGKGTAGVVGASSSAYCVYTNGFYPVGEDYVCEMGTGTNRCTSCAAGTYKPTIGFTSCKACPANSTATGLTKQAYASTACSCSAGYYGLVDINSTICIACPADTFKSASGNAALCTSCPTGTTTLGLKGQVSANACSAAPGFVLQPDGTYTCDVGRSGSTCQLCPAGSYKAETGFSSCTSCPYSMVPTGFNGSVALSDACTCAPGFSNFTGTSCQMCTADSFKSSSGSDSCSACPQNSTAAPGSASCSCSAGYYSDGTACSACPINTYKNSSDNESQCRSCGFGFGTSGLEGQSYCTLLTGYALDGDNSVAVCDTGYGFNSDANQCTACGAGTYKSYVGMSSCSTCDQGYTSLDSLGASSCVVSAGFYALNNGTVVPCPVNTYKPAGNASECLACAWGYSTQDVTGATSVSQCIAKPYTYYRGGDIYGCIAGYEPVNDSCVACENGFYKTSAGPYGCDSCPSSQVSAANQGSTYCVAQSSSTTVSQQQSRASESSSGTGMLGAAIGGAVGAFVLLAVVVGGITFSIRRRSSKNGKSKSLKDSPTMSTITFSLPNLTSKPMRTHTDGTHTHNNNEQAVAFPAFLNLESEDSVQLICKIGEGGFSTIYAAELLEEPVVQADSQVVACKVFKKRRDEEIAMADFENEASALYALQICPNVARLYALVREPEPRLIMKMYTESLSAYLHSPYSKTLMVTKDYTHPAVAMVITCQMLNALKVLHSMDMAHLDVKPGNMLLEVLTAGQSLNELDLLPVRLVICDFGNVRMLSKKFTVKGLRGKVTNALSVNYAAPEAVNVTKLLEADSAVEGVALQRLDVFSASCSAYELLTKQVPFAKRSVYEIQQDLLQALRPEWPAVDGLYNTKEKNLYGDLKALIVSGWNQTPKLRPTMEDLYDQACIMLEEYHGLLEI